jgi:hypothetical protein
VKGAPFSGIIAHLTVKCGGNVHEKGVVNVIGNPLDNNQKYAARHVVDFDDRDSHFWSVNAADQALVYDFKQRAVVVREYAMSGWRSIEEWGIID